VPSRKSISKKTKYIFVSGGVISGIGKGITSASTALLLKSAGYSIAPIKLEGYLNIDAGTINPIEHGDTFLCEDGTEADMDLGTYEKFLHQDMGKYNFGTMGQVYQRIIEKERRFEYKGEDVEAVHITEEIIERIVRVGKEQEADIVMIELGGTAGEYWNIFYYEAARLLAFRNPGDVIHIHVSYVPTPGHLGEPKTKPTQLSVRTLNSMGIQPDFIIARAEKPLDARRKDRFAIFCNMHPEDIISNPDVSSVYKIPFELYDQGLHKKILKKLHLPVREPILGDWEKLLQRIEAPKKKTVEIAIVGKYFGTGEYQLKDSYAALFDAIDHASWEKGVEVKTRWVDAEKVESAVAKAKADKKEGIDGVREIIGRPDGIIVPIGWGERGSEGMIAAASYARTEKIPYLGLCFGMQLASVAFARDMLGWKDANTEENNPKSKHKVIHFIAEQKELIKKRAYGGTMRLGGWNAIIKKGTRAWDIYERYNGFINKSKGLTSERHRHRYEFNSNFIKDYEKQGFVISATSEDVGLVEIIELPAKDHPFYLGTQGHPEYKSRPLTPHPIFLAYIEAVAKKK
jgi:CTP synthase